MNFAFRVDASIHMGSGHVARCATLADYLRQCGGNSTFICRELPGHYCDWLTERGYAVQRLPAPSSVHHRSPDGLAHAAWLGVPKEQEIREAGEALRQIGHVDWLIVDHYALDAEWERAMRTHVPKIMAIDDLADRSHDADLLLDQNLQPHAGRYNGLLPPSCVQLLGPAFALLRPEFSGIRAVLEPRNGEVQRVLVFMGGGDIRNVTGKVLDALTGPETAHLAIDIILTRGNPYYEELQSRCNALRNCTLHVQTTDMASLMAKADLMIGGSGSATWERCCLGLPSVLISIAENQRALGQAVSGRRAAIYLGDDEAASVEHLRSLLTRLLSRPGLLRRIGSRASGLVDGRGARRVATALLCHLRVTIISDRNSWINEYLTGLTEAWQNDGHTVNWVHETEGIAQGDCAFFLSFSRIANAEILTRNTHNLVVHESDLPRGRGWSPLTWQILEGANRIPVTLFEAAANVDSGVIYDQELIEFAGDELIDELRHKQASATVKLCRRFLENYPGVIASGRAQTGQASYYPRRQAQDSRLDPGRSIAEQFNLLRVVDSQRYPAWFEWAGNKYLLHIQKADKHEI